MIEGVHIWRAALDEAGWPGPEQLPAPERQRAASSLRREASRRWVAARWALRRVLASYLDQPAAAIELEEGEHGKPRLHAVGVAFSLSHSNGLALVAVAEGCEVGIDVEAIEPGRDLVALAERALSSEEAAAVRGASESERPALFYAAWTRHEARLKSTEARDRTPTDPIAVENLPSQPGYAAAVAVTRAQVGPVERRSLRAG